MREANCVETGGEEGKGREGFADGGELAWEVAEEGGGSVGGIGGGEGDDMGRGVGVGCVSERGEGEEGWVSEGVAEAVPDD